MVLVISLAASLAELDLEMCNVVYIISQKMYNNMYVQISDASGMETKRVHVNASQLSGFPAKQTI